MKYTVIGTLALLAAPVLSVAPYPEPRMDAVAESATVAGSGSAPNSVRQDEVLCGAMAIPGAGQYLCVVALARISRCSSAS